MVEETFFDGIESWRVDQHPPLVLERGQMAPNARVICVVAAPPTWWRRTSPRREDAFSVVDTASPCLLLALPTRTGPTRSRRCSRARTSARSSSACRWIRIRELPRFSSSGLLTLGQFPSVAGIMKRRQRSLFFDWLNFQVALPYTTIILYTSGVSFLRGVIIDTNRVDL